MNTEVKNARYWLLAARDYEASGGLDDLKAISNDIEELHLYPEKDEYRNDFYEIVDTQTWTTIYLFDRSDDVWVYVNKPIKIFHKE